MRCWYSPLLVVVLGSFGLGFQYFYTKCEFRLKMYLYTTLIMWSIDAQQLIVIIRVKIMYILCNN